MKWWARPFLVFVCLYVALLLVFAGIYTRVSFHEMQKNEVIRPSWLQSCYLSVNVQTFLGLGRYSPQDTTAEMLVSLQVLGSVALMIMLATWVNKPETVPNASTKK